MSDSYKCPYCIETRPSRSRLRTHIDSTHRHADTRENRAAAALAARKVEDVVADIAAAVAPVVCICGGALKDMDADEQDSDTPWWVHVTPGGPCLDAVPASETIKSQGRPGLSRQLADTGERLVKAGDEIRALREKADAVQRRLDALDAGIMTPNQVRRATLMQVWDKLMDAGNTTGAQLVMRMHGATGEGDWS
jgi:hypothetical protein